MMLSIKLYKNFLTFNLIVNSASQKKKKSATTNGSLKKVLQRQNSQLSSYRKKLITS